MPGTRQHRLQGKNDGRDRRDSKEAGIPEVGAQAEVGGQDPVTSNIPATPVMTPTSPSAVADVSVSQTDKQASTPQAHDSTGPLLKQDFAKHLALALRNQEVQQAFQSILHPMMVSYVDGVLKPVHDKVEDLETELLEVKEEVADNKMKNDASNTALLTRVRELERLQKIKSVRISGITLDDSSGGSLSQKCSSAVEKMLTEAQITGVTVSDFDSFSKINVPGHNGSTTIILAKLVSEDKKFQLFQQKKKLRDCTQKYFINEDLTKHDSKIFSRLRKEVKNGTIHSCWTRNGVCWAKSCPDGKPFSVQE